MAVLSRLLTWACISYLLITLVYDLARNPEWYKTVIALAVCAVIGVIVCWFWDVIRREIASAHGEDVSP